MYCVYLTLYFGDLLPSRYIGSSKVSRILNGYNGSIKSKKYKDLYRNEQMCNKNKFKTRILSYHNNQTDAILEELRLQKKYNVVKSIKYMNESFASPNGYHGKDNHGDAHPFYGKKHTEDVKNKISNTLKLKYEEGILISPFTFLDTKGENNPFYGKKHTEETKNKMRKPKKIIPKFKCPHCGKIYDGGNMTQHLKRNGIVNDGIEKYKIY